MFPLSHDDRLNLASRLLHVGMIAGIFGVFSPSRADHAVCLFTAIFCLVSIYMVARDSASLPGFFKTGSFK